MLHYSLGVNNTKRRDMFRKLVLNLPFSPTLVEQVGFYARRLQKEEITRRYGIIMTVIALLVQSFVVLSPISSANASHSSDMIHGGIASKDALLAQYDAKDSDLRSIFDYAGVSRDELANSQLSTISSRQYGTGVDAWHIWGRIPHFSEKQGEQKHVVSSTTTIYSRPLWQFDTSAWTHLHGTTYPALTGTSSARGEFAVVLANGNLVTRTLPGVTPENTSLVRSKAAFNLTQGVDATQTTAMPGDRIEYRLTMTNDSDHQLYTRFEESLGDVLEYATLQNLGGGTFQQDTAVLTWPYTSILANSAQTRTFVVSLPRTIPATARGQSEPSSYDCIMSNTFGDNVQFRVACDSVKSIESIIEQFPTVSVAGNAIFGIALLAVVLYFWARSRQLKREIRLIRHQFSGSTI